MNELAAGTVGRPTVASGMNVRWRIFFLILGTVAINYIHRASLPVAMPNQPRVKYLPGHPGLLLSSFFWTCRSPAGCSPIGSCRVCVDLLISDIGLAGRTNGRQMAHATRVVHPDLKVLFITGCAAEQPAVGDGPPGFRDAGSDQAV